MMLITESKRAGLSANVVKEAIVTFGDAELLCYNAERSGSQ